MSISVCAVALTSNIVYVLRESPGESVVTALTVNILLSRILTAPLQLVPTARLGHRLPLQTSSGDILPVSPAGDSTALESSLNFVPGEVHPLVVQGSVVLHPLLHVGLDGGAKVSRPVVNTDNCGNLSGNTQF